MLKLLRDKMLLLAQNSMLSKVMKLPMSKGGDNDKCIQNFYISDRRKHFPRHASPDPRGRGFLSSLVKVTAVRIKKGPRQT